MKKFSKIVLALFVMTALLALGALTAFAQGNVTYVGGAEKFVFKPGSEYSPDDLFENFKDLMPGDVRTQQIVVKNGVKNKAKIYLRSLGGQEETNALLANMKLTVTAEGDTTLFEAPLDQTATLIDFVALGTVLPEGEVTLNLKLEVSPDMGPEFMESVGYVDWEFMVEEIEEKPDMGEDSNLVLWTVLSAAALLIVVGVVVAIIVINRRQNKQAD